MTEELIIPKVESLEQFQINKERIDKIKIILKLSGEEGLQNELELRQKLSNGFLKGYYAR